MVGHTLCSICGRRSSGWLWCRQCLGPYIEAGRAFERLTAHTDKTDPEEDGRIGSMKEQEAH